MSAKQKKGNRFSVAKCLAQNTPQHLWFDSATHIRKVLRGHWEGGWGEGVEWRILHWWRSLPSSRFEKEGAAFGTRRLQRGEREIPLLAEELTSGEVGCGPISGCWWDSSNLTVCIFFELQIMSLSAIVVDVFVVGGGRDVSVAQQSQLGSEKKKRNPQSISVPKRKGLCAATAEFDGLSRCLKDS